MTNAELARGLYGDEQAGRPPQTLYTREDGHRALEEAQRVHARAQRLLDALGGR